ncbi:MAG: helix-hairpin-helix domain-containing protein [Methanomethylovorans sp.]|uniref:helix-hairpin-helix domain-containing protein n=1 Tax=Methanomethylovorans sp. TaxID=2758717 RepID=UPI003530973B
MKALIIDGYVDEPACFGVPPYISPYIRYLAGAMREQGIHTQDIFYSAIDSIRINPKYHEKIIKEADLVVVIAGMTVPGKYLRSTPINLQELHSIIRTVTGEVVIGGPIRLGFSSEGGKKASILSGLGNAFCCRADVEAFVYDLVRDGKLTDPANVIERLRSVQEIGRWGTKGAFIIRQHPDYPNVMCELETYRGCGRKKHCSFCTEPFYGKPAHRPVDDVILEVQALYQEGSRHFRIGRQPDLLSYQSNDKGGDLPVPNPEAIESLYMGIRQVAPDLQVLHMDNANPATIAAFPEESRQILSTIVKYHTSGDVAAMGMESADPGVIKRNGLKVSPDEMFSAIELINKIGAKRGASGMPELLPGLNFVHGLMGETKETFRLNYDFLKKVLDSGLLLRRINIRQVMAFEGTPMFGNDAAVAKHKKEFLRYKEKVRKEIDLPMLRKLVPAGTILRNVLLEVNDGNTTFGRQMGSYPLLIGLPSNLGIGQYMDVTVVDHGFRSITAIPYPIDINNAELDLLQRVPGLGKVMAAKIFRERPYMDAQELISKTSVGTDILKYIQL